MNALANPGPAPGNDTGATAALAGYDYQLDVSILAALRILFVTKSASHITLEPANADDIEIELEEDDPGHVETQAELGVTARLIMQVHDELVLEVETSAAEAAARTLTALMEEAADLAVPLKVEAGIGGNWDEAH